MERIVILGCAGTGLICAWRAIARVFKPGEPRVPVQRILN